MSDNGITETTEPLSIDVKKAIENEGHGIIHRALSDVETFATKVGADVKEELLSILEKVKAKL